MKSKSFTYSTLPANEKWIRLLQLRPAADPSAAIEGALLDVPLGGDHAYTALSYAWKDKDDAQQTSATISLRCQGIVDDVAFTAPKNAAHALRRLRHRHKDKLFWIDSICINMEDQVERTRQVNMMGEIYRHASQVDIWLGEKYDDDELGEWLQGIYARTVVHTDWQHDEQSRHLVDQYLEGYKNLAHSDKSPLRQCNDVYGAFCLIWLLAQGTRLADVEFYDNTTWSNIFKFRWTTQVSKGLRAILDRTWWLRSWVVQETVFASKARVVYSTMSAPWTMFSRAAMNHQQGRWTEDLEQQLFIARLSSWGNATQSVDYLTRFVTSVMAIERTRMEWIEQQPIALLQLLRRYRSRRSSDKRDKVFSILGLMNMPTKFPLAISYEQDVYDVSLRTMIHVIRDTRCLDVLMGSVRGVEGFGPLAPSWTTDWSTNGADYESERLERSKLYRATRSRVEYAAIHGAILEVRGRFLGLVQSTFPSAPESGVERLRMTINGLQEHLGQHALWRIVCGDIIYDADIPDLGNDRERNQFRRLQKHDEDAFDLWLRDESTKRNRYTSVFGDMWSNGYKEPKETTRRKNEYYYSMQASLVSRRLFTCDTQQQSLSVGIGPQTLVTGDCVFVAFGSRVPFILRKHATMSCCSHGSKHIIIVNGKATDQVEPCGVAHETFLLVGDAYLDGMMDGSIEHMELEERSVFLC